MGRRRNTELQDLSVTDSRASQSNQFYTKNIYLFTPIEYFNHDPLEF